MINLEDFNILILKAVEQKILHNYRNCDNFTITGIHFNSIEFTYELKGVKKTGEIELHSLCS